MARLRAAALAALAAAGCGDNLYDPFVGLVRVSGTSPFPEGCDGRTQSGTNFRGAEVEPWIAVDPTDPMHMIGVWQQDRWSNGGAKGLVTATSFDGGATWQRSLVPFSRCTGGDASNGGDFERATDPWVTFGPDGTAYQSALAFDKTSPRHAILASRSTDGGLSWSAPATLRADSDLDVFNDKETITADPTDARFVYAVWDRLTGLTQPSLPIGTGPVWFARATEGAWEPARPIYDPGTGAATIGNVVVVLPDGVLVDVFTVSRNAGDGTLAHAIAVIRSTDRGDTWSPPVEIAKLVALGVRGPDRREVRSGTELPEIAVDSSTGALYVVWEDGRFGGGTVNGIAFARSSDGGTTWSPPRQLNAAPASAAFTPAIAVARDGTIGVTYYDLREPDPDDASSLRATLWLATSRDGGGTWSEERLTEPFDLRAALLGERYFLGDYQGLAASGGELVPFFAASNERVDVWVRPACGGPGCE